MEVLFQLGMMCVFGIVCALIAQGRGRSPIGWFAIGFIAPCLGLILVLVLPDLTVERARLRTLKNENLRLRERIRKDRHVADSRHADLSRRVSTHDRALGLDTGSRDSLLGDVVPPDLLPDADLDRSMSSAFETIDWYYVLDGEAKGPVAFSDMRALRVEGLVSGGSLVWHEGLAEWTTLSDVPGLLEELHG